MIIIIAVVVIVDIAILCCDHYAPLSLFLPTAPLSSLGVIMEFDSVSVCVVARQWATFFAAAVAVIFLQL